MEHHLFYQDLNSREAAVIETLYYQSDWSRALKFEWDTAIRLTGLMSNGLAWVAYRRIDGNDYFRLTGAGRDAVNRWLTEPPPFWADSDIPF